MKPANLQSGSRKLVGFAAALLLMLGFTLVAQGFIDTKDFREQIIQTIKDRTGKDVAIKGRVTARLLPTPGIFVPGLELRGVDDKDPAPTFTAQSVYVEADLLSLFSDQIAVSSITFENAVLEIRRSKEGVIHWDWLEKDMLKPMLALKDLLKNINLSFVEGKVFYFNDETNHVVPIRSINGSVAIGAEVSIAGGFIVGEQPLALESRLGVLDQAGFRPIDLRVFNNQKDEFTLKGQLGSTSEKLEIKGDFATSLSDISNWIAPFKQEKKTADAKALPLKLTGSWAQSNLSLKLDQLSLEGLDSKAAGSLAFAWEDIPDFDITMTFSEFNYDAWQALAELIAQRRNPQGQLSFKEDFEEHRSALPKEVNVKVTANANSVQMGEKTWQEANLSASLQDGSITINQLGIQMPGSASLVMFGIISQGAAKTLRFEGSMESQGGSLRDVLTIFDENAAEFSEAGFGAFSIRSNLFISAEQVRLSEAEVKLNELNLSGGLVAYFDSKPRVEADVKLRDINFDYFRDVWRESKKNQSGTDYFLRFDKNLNFGWLRKLKTNIDFKVMVDEFTFLETRGQSAAFRIFAQEGEFGIYNLRFYYPTHVIEASFNLNVKSDIPYFTMVFNSSSELDTRYFKVNSESSAATVVPVHDNKQINQEVTIIPQTQTIIETAASSDNPTDTPAVATEVSSEAITPIPLAKGAEKKEVKRWSEELFDMSWMEGYNATIDISLGKLIHKDTTLNRFKLKSLLRDRVMTIQALSFGYWQGRCDITGTIYGGKVPGTSLGFTVTNADLGDIISNFSERNNISGRLGVSGSFSTSGVNPLSWVQQADAKLTLNGVGVNVSNFNLQSVVDTVSVSRTTADVMTNVNLMLPRGSTEFSMEGYLNIKNGIVRTPGITLKSGNMMGNLTGELRLIPWTMNLSTLFQFPAMTSETVPTMNVQLTGSVDDADMTVDTDSLEAYVSKRIIGR